MSEKRGFTCEQAMNYVGVKRRTFDEFWRPRLIAIHQGTSLLFDKRDLDALFDELKRAAASPQKSSNITQIKGEESWVKKHPVSTPTRTVHGKSTNSTRESAFELAASQVLKRQMSG
jgi:hypothetical protein